MDNSPDPRAIRRRDQATNLLLALAVGAIVFALSWRVTSFDWVLFDDDINILLNPHLASNPARTFAWAFTNFDYIRRYLPLGWLQFDTLLALGGYNAAYFHVASCVLHATNAVLVWFVFRALLEPRTAAAGLADPQHKSRCAIGATIGAMLWSLHPLRAENVGWISGLLYLGSATLALTATLVYLHAEQRAGRNSGIAWRAASTVIFIGSLLVYAVFLALPLLLTFRGAIRPPSLIRGALAEARRLAGWWIAAIVLGTVNLYARITATGPFAAPIGVRQGGLIERAESIARVVLHYIARTVWPGATSPYYGHTSELLHQPQDWVIAVTVVLAATALLIFRRTRRTMVVMLVGSAIALAPILVQVDGSFSVSDRYALLGLGLWATAVGHWIAQQRSVRRDILVTVGATILVVASSTKYGVALAVWKNTTTVQAAIDAATADFRDPKLSYSRPAIAFWTLGQNAEADRRIAEGFRRFPRSPDLIAAKQLIEALNRQYLTRVAGESGVPPLAVMHVDLGRQHQSLGNLRSARAHFAAAVSLAPNYTEAQQAYVSTLRRQ